MKLHQLGLAPAPDQPKHSFKVCGFCYGNGTAEGCPNCGKVQEQTQALTLYSPDFRSNCETALILAKKVTSVSTSFDNARAVSSMQIIHDLRSDLEKARQRAIEPYLTQQRNLTAQAKELDKQLAEEELRLGRETATFAQVEQARVRDLKIAADKEQSELTRKHHAALAQAKTDDERDLISLDHHNQIQVLEIVPEPVLAAGQKVKDDWEVVVTDIAALYARFPNACTPPKAKLGEVKTLLDAGLTLPGIQAKKITRSSVVKSRALNVIGEVVP